MQILPQLDRQSRDMQRLVSADTERRPYCLQGSGLLSHPCMLCPGSHRTGLLSEQSMFLFCWLINSQ